MDKRLFMVIYLSFLLLLFSVLFNKLNSIQIKILSSLLFIIINFIFYIKFKKCFSEDISKKEKELMEKILTESKENIEELIKKGFIKINYQDKIDATTNNIKNKFKNLLDIFFKTDDKKDNNFKIYKSKKIKTIPHNTGVIDKIILLKDRRLAFAIYEYPENLNSILIYNTDNDSIDLKIDNLDSRVKDLMQTKNGNIIASLTLGFILVIKLTSTSYEIIQIIKAHDETVEKTIETKDGRLISCAEDKKIKIWKCNNNQYILDNILSLKKSKKTLKKEAEDRKFSYCCILREINKYDEFYSIDDIIELKNNIIVSISYGRGPIIFWNIKELEIICQNKEINFDSIYKLKKLSNKLFIIGGRSYLYLFSSLNYKLISIINIDSNCESICCLSDGSILTGHEDGKIRQYNLINNEFNFIGEKQYHNYSITDIIQLKKDLVISRSFDKIIIIYKNKCNIFW